MAAINPKIIFCSRRFRLDFHLFGVPQNRRFCSSRPAPKHFTSCETMDRSTRDQRDRCLVALPRGVCGRIAGEEQVPKPPIEIPHVFKVRAAFLSSALAYVERAAGRRVTE